MLKKIALLLAASVTLGAAAETKITVDAGRKAAPIRHRLAGVSQGGNAGSFFKPEIREQLDRFPLPLVRIEMITNSRPHALYSAATGKFDWTKLDEEIEAVQKRGGEVMINLFGTPAHLASDPSAKVPAFTPPADFQAYADFCAEIVRHVNIEKKYKVRLWEFWNEPSGNWFWSAWRKDNKTFFKLYSTVARAIKAVDPEALVGGFGDNMQYPENYQAWFRYLKTDPAPVDFLSVHYYGDWSGKTPPSPESYTAFVERLSAMAERELGAAPPVYVAEWNLSAESNGKFSAPETAAWIASALCRMQRNDKIEGAAFFRVEHYKDPSSSLFDRTGRWRVAARLLSDFSRIPAKGIASGSPSPDIAVVAGGDESRLALLIGRFNRDRDAKAESARIEVRRLKADTVYNVAVRLEDSLSAAQPGEGEPEARTVKTSAAGTLSFELDLEPCCAGSIVIHGE